MNKFDMLKFPIVIPISIQLPVSRTKKKNTIAIKSLSAIAMKKLFAGSWRFALLTAKNAAATRRKGRKILAPMSPVMVNGLNTVTKRYVEETSNPLMLAMFPVLKNDA